MYNPTCQPFDESLKGSRLIAQMLPIATLSKP
jgi:hypothetical protein